MKTDGDLLVQYIATNDQSAFEELLRRHGPMVCAAARRLAPSDADDITQAVFILLLGKASSLCKQSNLAGWLYQTALYCARNARRAQNRRDHHERQTPMPEPSASTDPAIRELLDTALAELGGKSRDVILLRYLEGLTIADSAQRLGISTEAVEKRAERGLAKLRTCFAAAGHDIPAAGVIVVLSAETTHYMPSGLLQAILAPSAKASALAKSAGAVYAAATLKAAAMLILSVSALAAGTIAAVHAAGTPAPPATTVATVRPYTAIESPEEANAPGQPALYTYSVGVEEPVARELEKLGFRLPGDPQAYHLYRADAEKVRQLLAKEFAAGNVVGMRSLNRPEVRPLAAGGEYVFDGLAISASRDERDAKWDPSFEAYFPKGRISRTPQGLRIAGQLQTIRIWANAGKPSTTALDLRDVGSTQLDVEISGGQALIGVLDLGTVGTTRRSHVIVWHCVRSTPEQAAVLNKADEAVQWLRVGPAGARMVVDYATAYRAAATQPSTVHDEAAWTKTLSDGTRVRLVSIGLPVHYPFLTWDPDGNPLAERGYWLLCTPGGRTIPDASTINFAIDSPHPLGEHFTEVQYPDGAAGYQHLSLGGTYPTERVSELVIRVGVGPWQDAGRIQDGGTIKSGDIQLCVRQISTSGPNDMRIAYTLQAGELNAITFVAVTKSGKRIWPEFCHTAAPHSSGEFVTPLNTENDAMFYQRGEDIEHIEALWRKAETVRFAGYAMQPNERPPFDLARDYPLSPSVKHQ